MGRPLRVGWIGVFAGARTFYLPSLAEWEDVEITAVCHPDADRLAAISSTMGIRKTFTQPGVMLRQSELDAVFVTVPNAKSQPVLEACIQRRLHVCTTPPTLPELGQLRGLARSVQEAGVRFNVLFPWRHIQLLSDMKGEIESAGPLSHIAVTLHAPPGALSPDENARADKAEWLAGVDLLRKLGGEIQSLSGVVAAYHGSRHPNCLSALVHFAGGATGVLLSDRTAGERRETVEIHGPELTGLLDLKADGKIFAAAAPAPRIRNHPMTDDGPAPVRITGGFDTAARKFVDSIRHGSESETEIGETIRTMELLQRIGGAAAAAAPGEQFEELEEIEPS